jgi:SPP1 family predicted phage head-tail adaptor
MRTDMRSLINIILPQKSVDADGETVKTWTVFATAYASKEPILGNVFFQAEATQSRVEVKFRTYFLPGVTNDMRIADGAETYEVLSAINVKGLDRELLMYCRKVQDE